MQASGGMIESVYGVVFSGAQAGRTTWVARMAAAGREGRHYA
jgi:hypothetical protein